MVVLAAVLLTATGAYGTLFWFTHDPGPPSSAFAPAAQTVRDGFVDGDLILLLPAYATQAREYLGDLHPVAVRRPLAEDLEIRDRVWLHALFGAEKDVGSALRASGFERAARHDFDGIVVERYERSRRAEVRYRFVDRLRAARVFHEKDGELVPCDRWVDTDQHGGPGGRWVCPYDGEWFYVAPEWHRMGDHLRRCLWAHPPHQGRLVVRFPSVLVSGTLAGRAGHTLNSSRHARAPVHLDVSWGDVPPQRFTFALADHFRPFRLEVPTTTTATVSFAVSSPDAGANHFCFVADLRQRSSSGAAEGRSPADAAHSRARRPVLDP